MNYKETVKNKLVHVKDEAIRKAAELAPYIAILAASGSLVYIVTKAGYNTGYGQGFIDGNLNGKKAVIEIINDLAKSVETK